MRNLFRRCVGLLPQRARRSCAVLLACGSLLGAGCGPAVALAHGLESCLILPAEPALEWTLVTYPSGETDALIATADTDEIVAPPVSALALAGQPTWADDGIPLEAAALGAPSTSAGSLYVRAWLPITIGELSLLTITAMLPKDWTGWSANFVGEGAGHFAEAWTKPPIMDTDHWFHNYIGHPYGGSFYYNSVRTRGAPPMPSMAFAAALSFQWEYIFEAVAERPSIQDLVITPIAGAALGELTHRMSRSMRKGRVTLPEKVVMTVLNPADVLVHGYRSSDPPPRSAR